MCDGPCVSNGCRMQESQIYNNILLVLHRPTMPYYINIHDARELTFKYLGFNTVLQRIRPYPLVA